MHLKTRNVNTAFKTLVELFQEGRIEANPDRPSRVMAEHIEAPIVRRPSRNGHVMVIDEPVTITYTHPRERVLFNAARDANPFFHMYESLWMLAGRNDVAPLAYYASRMKEFSDDGKTFNGAYGYRWRHAAGGSTNSEYPGQPSRYDQLYVIVNHLKADPNSRRAVLQMWNVEDDLLKIGRKSVECDRCKRFKHLAQYDEGRCECQQAVAGSKDVCCNLSVMFSLREPKVNVHGYADKYLDITVTNRSNDLIWGCLGANFVHFSFLQEYMAAQLGAEVGKYHHFSNNLHVYDDPGNPKVAPWRPEEWLAAENPNALSCNGNALSCNGGYGWDIGAVNPEKTVPFVRDPETFEQELPNFVRLHDGSGYYGHPVHHSEKVWDEPFLETVARPMLNAFHLHKIKAYDNALAWAGRIRADDWRTAAEGWLNRRRKK